MKVDSYNYHNGIPICNLQIIHVFLWKAAVAICKNKERKWVGGGGNKNNNDVYSPFPSFLLLPAGTSLVQFQQGSRLSFSISFLSFVRFQQGSQLSFSISFLVVVDKYFDRNVCVYLLFFTNSPSCQVIFSIYYIFVISSPATTPVYQ